MTQAAPEPPGRPLETWRGWRRLWGDHNLSAHQRTSPALSKPGAPSLQSHFFVYRHLAGGRGAFPAVTSRDTLKRPALLPPLTPPPPVQAGPRSSREALLLRRPQTAAFLFLLEPACWVPKKEAAASSRIGRRRLLTWTSGVGRPGQREGAAPGPAFLLPPPRGPPAAALQEPPSLGKSPATGRARRRRQSLAEAGQGPGEGRGAGGQQLPGRADSLIHKANGPGAAGRTPPPPPRPGPPAAATSRRGRPSLLRARRSRRLSAGGERAGRPCGRAPLAVEPQRHCSRAQRWPTSPQEHVAVSGGGVGGL